MRFEFHFGRHPIDLLNMVAEGVRLSEEPAALVWGFSGAYLGSATKVKKCGDLRSAALAARSRRSIKWGEIRFKGRYWQKGSRATSDVRVLLARTVERELGLSANLDRLRQMSETKEEPLSAVHVLLPLEGAHHQMPPLTSKDKLNLYWATCDVMDPHHHQLVTEFSEYIEEVGDHTIELQLYSREVESADAGERERRALVAQMFQGDQNLSVRACKEEKWALT